MLAPLGMRETAHRPTPDMRARLASMHQRDGGLTAARHGAARATGRSSPAAAACTGRSATTCAFSALWLNDGAGVLKPETVAWAARDGLDGLKVGPLPTVNPLMSGPIEFFPGLSKSWGYSFLINDEPAPTGRSAGSLGWGGLGNLYFWIDRARGVAGFWATQLFPFMDPVSLGGALAFETAVYEGLARGAARRAD